MGFQRIMLHRLQSTAIIGRWIASCHNARKKHADIFLVIAAVLSVCDMARADTWNFVGGTWTKSDGRLVQSDAASAAYAYQIDQAFTDCRVAVSFRVGPAGGGVRTAGIVLRSTESLNGYFVHFDPSGDQFILHRGDLQDGANEVDRKRGLGLETNMWHSVVAAAECNRITVHLEGRLVMSVKDDTHTLQVNYEESNIRFERVKNQRYNQCTNPIPCQIRVRFRA